jgi:hypothetical protein
MRGLFAFINLLHTMQKRIIHQQLLNIIVLAMAAFALAIDIIQILHKAAILAGWASILNFFDGIGMLLAFSIVGFIIYPWAIVSILVAAVLVVQQLWEKKWAWFSVSIVAAFFTVNFSSTALIAVGIAYYAFVLRPQLFGPGMTQDKSLWRGLAIVQATLTVIVAVTWIPMSGTTRSLVVKAAPGERAPFDLMTKTLPFPHDLTSGMYIEHLTFSPDGTRAAFLIKQQGNATYFVADGMLYDIDPIWYPELKFIYTDDSELLLFLVKNDRNISKFTEEERREGSFVGIKDRKSDTWNATTPLKRGEETYQVGNRTYASEDLSITFPYLEKRASNDGTRTAEVIAIRDCGMGGECLARVKVTEGNHVIYESANYDRAIHNLTFSDDGHRIAYTVGDVSYAQHSRGDGAYVVVDGMRGVTVDSIAFGSLRFSPNGKYIAYGAEKSGKIWWIVEELIPDAENITTKSLEKIVHNE